jgi:hypothetical protein
MGSALASSPALQHPEALIGVDQPTEERVVVRVRDRVHRLEHLAELPGLTTQNLLKLAHLTRPSHLSLLRVDFGVAPMFKTSRGALETHFLLQTFFIPG